MRGLGLNGSRRPVTKLVTQSSSKYWSINPLAGTPAETNVHTHTRTKKKNPARVRRSRLRQEEFFRKKQALAKVLETRSHMTNQATGNEELSHQMENQLTSQPAEGVSLFFFTYYLCTKYTIYWDPPPYKTPGLCNPFSLRLT